MSKLASDALDVGQTCFHSCLTLRNFSPVIERQTLAIGNSTRLTPRFDAALHAGMSFPREINDRTALAHGQLSKHRQVRGDGKRDIECDKRLANLRLAVEADIFAAHD